MDLHQFIDSAIQEDIQEGDHTSRACIPDNTINKGYIIAKESGILAGVELAQLIFSRIDERIKLEVHCKDGVAVAVGDKVMEMTGPSQSILKAERLVLNFMQRMSGIATLTNEYVKRCEGYPAKILDTRKTTPLFRYFQKWAVRIGGGENHRYGLYDMIMIKDNHIAFSGGIEKATSNVRNYLNENDLSLKVEIEAATLDQVKEILSVGNVDRIMIDNFSPELAKAAVELIGGKYETEISGGVNLDTVEAYAASGADYISVGALTHSAQSLDLSLRAS